MRYLLMALLTAAVAVACSKPESQSDARAAKSDTGMAGMDMSGSPTTTAMDSMIAQMRSFDTASATTLTATLPGHRQAVANMLSQMNGDMRSMKMSGDARWTALVDSIRTDLVRLAEATPQQSKGMLVAHRGRVTGLVQLHETMMTGMKDK